jgi:hypothetical protein
MISIILCFWTERNEDTVFERICIAACVVPLMHAILACEQLFVIFGLNSIIQEVNQFGFFSGYL